MTSAKRTARVIEISRSLGFDLCGVAPAEKFPELAHLENGSRGATQGMRYLHDARRQSPSHAVLGAQSVIVCALITTLRSLLHRGCREEIASQDDP